MEQIEEQLKCNEHKKKAIHIRTQVSQDSHMYLLCPRCVSKLQPRENIMALDDVRQCTKNSSIINWPQGLEHNLYDTINNEEGSVQNRVIAKLYEFQENMIYEITKKIKGIFIKQIDIIKEKLPYDSLRKQYHSLFQTDELIEIVNHFEDSKYESFLKEFEITREQKIQKLLTSIKQFQSSEQLIKFEELNKSQQQILDILSEMQFFNDYENNNKIDKKEKENNLERILQDANKYSNCNEQTVYDILKLLEKKKEIEEIGFNQSFTKQCIDQNFEKINEQFHINEIKSVFEKYPIFDICPQWNFPKNIISYIQLEKTSLNIKEDQMVISKNKMNQFEVSLQQQLQYLSTTNCVSNLILSKKNKYVFRIHIKSDGDCPLIGLMSSTNSNTKEGFQEKLSFHLRYLNGTLTEGNDNGISLKVKGGKIVLPTEVTLEMRVWQKEQLLEVLDYPEYKYKVALKAEHKHYLKTKEDLKLYLFLYNRKIKYTLTEAFIVKNFDD